MTRPQMDNRISLGNVLLLVTILLGAAGTYLNTQRIQNQITQRIEVEQTQIAGRMEVLRANLDARAAANAARIASLERSLDGEIAHIRRALDRIMARLDRMETRLDGARESADHPSRNAITGDPR